MKRWKFLLFFLLFTIFIYAEDNENQKNKKDYGLLILKIESNSPDKWDFYLYKKGSNVFVRIKKLLQKLNETKNDSGYYAIKLEAGYEYCFYRIAGLYSYWNILSNNRYNKVIKNEIIWGGIVKLDFGKKRVVKRIKYQFEDGTNEDFIEALNYLVKMKMFKDWHKAANKIIGN